METINGSLPFDLNEFQENLLDDYISNGGRIDIYQHERGRGYTTFVLYICLNQLLSTNRRVLFITDSPLQHIVHEIARVAQDFFGAKVVRNNNTGGFLINGKFLRIANPRYESQLRGLRFDDVYGDISAESYHDKREFFKILSHSVPPQSDGNGFHCLVIR